MQEAYAYSAGDACLDVSSHESATREIQDLLPRSLSSFYRSAYRLLGNTADAEDAVQDALFSAYKHLGQFKRQSSMSTWLTSIVRNCARMQLRKRLRQRHLSLDGQLGEEQDYSALERVADARPDPEDECRNSELHANIRTCLAQLSPSLRRVLQLRDLDGLSICQTAHVLGLQTGTVKAQLSRARKRLKQSMRRMLETRPQPITPYSLADRSPGRCL